MMKPKGLGFAARPKMRRFMSDEQRFGAGDESDVLPDDGGEGEDDGGEGYGGDGVASGDPEAYDRGRKQLPPDPSWDGKKMDAYRQGYTDGGEGEDLPGGYQPGSGPGWSDEPDDGGEGEYPPGPVADDGGEGEEAMRRKRRRRLMQPRRMMPRSPFRR